LLKAPNPMALRVSCLVHGLLLLVAGCSAHRPITAVAVPHPDPEISDATEFVGAVADKMPLWDADAISRYERVEIATVKADIAMAQQEEEKGVFLRDVAKLHDDWDALLALDEMLKKESLT
jgi:hypothetical protein